MPIDFPSSPTTGQVYTYLGKSWVYNGTGWDAPKALSEIGAVRTFANAADRTAAIPSPTEGIVTYLNDVDALEVNNGSAWVNAGNNGRGLVAFTETIITSSFSANSNTKILEVTFPVFAGRRYLIGGRLAVQPSSTAAPNALFISETSLGSKTLAYQTTAIGANLNLSFTGFHLASSASFGVTTGNSSKTIGLFFRCGSAGGVATNPDNVVAANSFVPQLYVQDIGAA